jgi:glycosyltransferase involved in cell wall biosynthesis
LNSKWKPPKRPSQQLTQPTFRCRLGFLWGVEVREKTGKHYLELVQGIGVVESRCKGRRVLIIVENLPVPFDRRVWQEAQSLRDAGYQVSVICPIGRAHKVRSELLDGISIFRHPSPIEARGPLGYLFEYANAIFWQTLLAWRIALTRGFDIIQGCNPPDNIFLVALPFKLLGKKYVFDQHDISPEVFEAKFGRRGILHRILLLLEWCSFRTADVVLVTNESIRKIAEERGKIRKDRIYVVRNGPDLQRVRLLPENTALRRGRRYLVGYVGVMGKQEGIDLLLRVIRNIVHVRGRSDIQFALIGDGTELSRMKAYARELRIEEHVTFTGYLQGDNLFELLSTSDVCVSPDIPNEMNNKSTMVKIMEYMALEKPIVQFDLVEGRYSAQQASLYVARSDEVEFADKILFLLDRPDERRRMGRIGRERVLSELAWPHQASKLLSAYKAALSGHWRDEEQDARAVGNADHV